MNAAPRTVFNYLRFEFRLEIRSKLGVVGDPRLRILRNVVEAKREGHVTMPVMMSIRLAIGSHMHKLRAIFLRKRACQRISKAHPVVKQAIEGDALRNVAVVKEHCDRPT